MGVQSRDNHLLILDCNSDLEMSAVIMPRLNIPHTFIDILPGRVARLTIDLLETTAISNKEPDRRSLWTTTNSNPRSFRHQDVLTCGSVDTGSDSIDMSTK